MSNGASTAGFPGEIQQTNQGSWRHGQSFPEESSDLLSLDTKDIAQPSYHSWTTNQHYARGMERFHEFMKGLESQEQDLFFKSITKNTVNFLTQEPAATDSKQKALTW